MRSVRRASGFVQTPQRLAMSRRLSRILDLFAEDSQLNVYAGELEVRPPGAPTIEWEQRLSAVGGSSAP
jgi:hypothetical protein